METWDLWYPGAAATGLPFARGRLDPTDVLWVHSAPKKLDVTVRRFDGSVRARGQVTRAGDYLPMTRLALADGGFAREDRWPSRRRPWVAGDPARRRGRDAGRVVERARRLGVALAAGVLQPPLTTCQPPSGPPLALRASNVTDGQDPGRAARDPVRRRGSRPRGRPAARDRRRLGERQLLWIDFRWPGRESDRFGWSISSGCRTRRRRCLPATRPPRSCCAIPTVCTCAWWRCSRRTPTGRRQAYRRLWPDLDRHRCHQERGHHRPPGPGDRLRPLPRAHPRRYGPRRAERGRLPDGPGRLGPGRLPGARREHRTTDRHARRGGPAHQ